MKWFVPIKKTGTILVFSGICLLLPADPSWAEETGSLLSPPPDVSDQRWRPGMRLKQVEQVPEKTWERISKAEKWVWDEYPDEVLIVEEHDIHFPRYLSAALNTPDWLDLALSSRLRREGFDYPFQADQQGSTWQWAQRTRFRASARWKAFRAELELQGSSSGENASTDVVGIETFNSGNVQQFFVALTLPDLWQTGLRTDLHVGRLNLDIGSRRLVARSRFGNTSQEFDGIHWNLENLAFWQFRAFFSEVVLNQNTTGRWGLFTNKDALFWGVSYETRQLPWSRVHLYYFGMDTNKTKNREARTFSTFGLRLYQPPQTGRMDYDGETVWQVGTIDGKDHFAYFQHVSLGYTFELPWTPRIFAMYDYASGTDSPNGNYSQTFDGLFGARRAELTPTGLFGPFFRSNISSPGIRLIVRPLSVLRLDLKYRAWYLAQSKDAWTNSGLRDPTGASGNMLGQDLEVALRWNPWPNLSVDAGYEHFFKGSYIKNQTNVPGNPPAQNTNYFYLQTEIRF